MPKFRVLLRNSFLMMVLLALRGTPLSAQTNRNLAIWEKEISAFEQSDRTNPPAKGGILFVGSSSFRKWTTLARDIPEKQIINRGFGGSEIGDSTALAERIIFPYEPKLIVLYAGDNDLANGKSVAQVVDEYREFVKKVRARLPAARIAYLSIKPSILRWKLRDQIVSVNEQIKAMKGDSLEFIDIYPAMIGVDGKPKGDLLLSDGLHPSEKCYRLWAGIIKPYLDIK